MNASNNNAERSGPRTLANARQWMHDKLAKRVHPLGLTEPGTTAAVIDSLQGLDGVSWAAAWRSAGDKAFAAAGAALAAGNRDGARTLYLEAYGFYFLGRFPCPNHPDKLECYRLEREAYLAAGRLMAAPVERVTVPFPGRAGEGTEVVCYVRRPNVSVAGIRPRVVLMWGGVDAWKEEMTEVCNTLLARGIATVAMDNVGTGESPVVAVPDADRQFVPVLDWIAAQADLDGARPAILGRSFGGYWATKLAHQHKDRLAAAVSWGGGAHFMFQRDWVEASRHPESYLMDLVETRSRMLGARNDDEYIAAFARLSLLDQGILDQPCAPLLLVNGKDDRQCPIADIHLLLDHGDPKAVRLFPGGHMGFGPHTVPTIVRWLEQRLDESESKGGRMSNWLQAMPTAEAYGLNKVLFELHHKADDLAAYRNGAEAYLDRYELTPRVRAAIRDNDVAALYLAGANPYLLRAHCIGMRIPEAVSLAALRSAAGGQHHG